MTNNLGVALGAIKVNTSDLKNADLAIRSAGRGMVGLGVAAVAAFGYVVGEAAKFEKEMDFVQAVTNATAEEMKGLEKAALDLAKNSVYGPIELSKAFVELVKAGATAQQIIEGVGRASVNLAQAADVTVPFAGENLINILNTFKLGAEDAVRVSDLLAGAANASSVELIDLVTSFKYAGPVAQGLGIDISDLNVALTILGKVGIKGSTAGTSLRQIMLNLSPPTKAAADQMKELGIITEDGANLFFDSAGNAKSLADVFEILREKTKNLNNEQKTEALRDLFGVRAIPAALELLSQGAEGFAALDAEINRTTAADVAAKRMDNLDGSLKRLKATLSAVFVEAGGPFQQMLKSWVDGLRDVILFIDGLPGPVKTFIVAAVGIIGVLSLMSGIFLLTIGNIVRAVRVFGELANVMPLVAKGFGTAARFVKLFTMSLLTNPVFLLIAALVALAVGFYFLYTRVEGFRKFIDNLWQNIQKAWDGITKGFYDLYKSITGWLGSLIDWLSRLPENAKKVAEEVFNFIKNLPGEIAGAIGSAAGAVGGFFADIGSAAKDFAVSMAKGVGGGIADGIGAIGRFFGSLPGLLGKIGGSVARFLLALPAQVAKVLGFVVGRFIKTFLITIPKAVFQGAKLLVTTFIKVLTTLPGMVVRVLGSIISTVVKFGVEVVKTIFKIGFTIVSTLISALIALPGQIWGILMQILNFLISFVPMAISAAFDIGSGIFSALWSFVSRIPGIVFNALKGALGHLIGLLGQFISAAFRIGSGIFNAIIDFFISLPGRIVDLLWEAVNAIGGMVSYFWNKAKEIGSNLWEGFKDGLFGSPHTKIEYAMWDMEANMKESMRNVSRNIKTLQGMQGRIPDLNSSALGLSTPAQTAFTSNGGGINWAQNAPLIGSASIRDERDIVTLARQLDNLQRDQLASRGRRVVMV